LSSVLIKRDREKHEKKKEKERKKERKEQASILYVRVPAQQREIKHRGVTKTAEALSL
jgi:hypothetical protein